MIYADSFLPEKEGGKNSAKLPTSFFSSILLVSHHTILWLSFNNSNIQVSSAIAGDSDDCVSLYLCAADRETDQVEQELVLFPPISE